MSVASTSAKPAREAPGLWSVVLVGERLTGPRTVGLTAEILAEPGNTKKEGLVDFRGRAGDGRTSLGLPAQE